MTNTLATRKQSRAIRDRMQEIRSDMPYDADIARARLQDLTDWKYHMRKHPWPIVAAVAVAGYLLVPAKREERVIVHSSSGAPPEKPAAKKGMLAGITGALLTLAIKQGTSVATRHLSNSIFPQRPSASTDEGNPMHSYSDHTS